MSTVYLIGNGESRRDFDLNQLVGKGAIIGCNEAHTAFDKFDVIVSVDGPSTRKLKAGYTGRHAFKDRDTWKIETRTFNLPTLPPGFGHDSGRLAILVAMELFKPSRIYLLGYDFGGTRLFTGHKQKRPVDYEKVWNHLMDKYPCEYIYVGDNYLLPKLNCKAITYEELV